MSGEICMETNGGQACAHAGQALYAEDENAVPVIRDPQDIPADDVVQLRPDANPFEAGEDLDILADSSPPMSPPVSPPVVEPEPIVGPCTGAAQCIVFTFGNSDGDFGVGVLGLQSVDFEDPSVERPVLDGFTTTGGENVTRNMPASMSVSNAQQGKADGALNAGTTLTWGRWRASGDFTGGAGGPFPFPVKITGGGGEGGLMYVTGPPTVDMPTSGIATYSPSCSLKCDRDGKFEFTTVRSSTSGGGGDLRSGGLAVDFGNFKVGADFTVEHQDAAFTYNVRTMGGLANPSQSQLSIVDNTFSDTAPLFATSPDDCGAGCRTNINGFFSGVGASAAGIAYNIRSDTQGQVFGAAAFDRQ
jgi:hypothetical protein